MASVEVTLSLLAGPTRAAVSSALYGASAATLLYASSNPALCFVARVPYDDAIFKHQQVSYFFECDGRFSGTIIIGCYD